MLRKLVPVTFNVLAALSLLLCISVCVLWVRSYWFMDDVWCARAGGRMGWASSYEGSAQIQTARGWPADEPVQWLRHDLRAWDEYDGRDGYDEQAFGGVPPTYHVPHTQELPEHRRLRREWTLPLGVRVSAGMYRTSWRPGGSALTQAEHAAVDPAATEVWQHLGPSAPMPYREAVVPLWLPAAAFAIPPLACLGTRGGRIVMGRRRRRSDHCPACGYDLRATPRGCPECGRAT